MKSTTSTLSHGARFPVHALGLVLLTVLFFVATACAPKASDSSESSPESSAAATVDPATPRYLLLAAQPSGETQAFARVILPAGSGCPTVVGSGAVPQNGIAMSPRAAEARFGFPQVCEAAVPFGATLAIRFADGSELSLPTAAKNPQKILAMGDTGCSSCAAGEPATEFAALATAAAGKPWDVILHMGDYNYRGTPSKVTLPDGTQTWAYDAGDGTEQAENCLQSDGSAFVSQNAPGNTPHDSWEAWNSEFFEPAGELLWAAPWAFARGNHELCSRAGPGWFYFLDPSSNLPEGGGKQLSCPAADPPSSKQIDNVILGQPYVVDLENLRVVMVDSANACDSFATPAMSDFTDAYTQQFSQIGTLLASNTAPAWVMTHRPMWGIQTFDAGKSTSCVAGATQYSCINQTLQFGLEHGLSGTWPDSVALSLAGHMHHFQTLTFQDSDIPPQFIIGNGGVTLGDWGPAGTFTTAVDSDSGSTQESTTVLGTALAEDVVDAEGETVSAFGFMAFELQPGGAWTGTLNNMAVDVELATCSSAQAENASVCSLTVTPSPADPSG